MNLLLVFPVHTRIHIEKSIVVEQEQFEENKIEKEIVQDEQFVRRHVQY